MELKVTTDLAVIPQEIAFNEAAITEWLEERLEHYNALVVTEDGIKDAKADKATLNKLRQAIEDKRKDIKKQCMAPYNTFEGKIKNIVAMIDKPILAIDSQIKEFDEVRARQKYDDITAYYEAHIGALKDALPLDMIINPKWRNVTVSMDAITAELSETIERVSQDLKVIQGMDGPYVTQMQDKYLSTLDLSAAIAEGKRLDDRQKQIDAIKAADAAEAERRAARAAEQAAKPKAEEPPATADFDFSVEDASIDEPTVQEIDFRVWVTEEQKAALRTFLMDSKIKYGRVQ